MNILDCAIKRTTIIFVLFIVIIIFCQQVNAEELELGSRFKVIRPIYLMAVYKSLNNRKISRETTDAYLHSRKYYEKSWVAFQSKVPVGTIMTVIGKTPKIWYLPFSADRYFVHLDPDISRGLDIILELNRGIEGELDGLNPELFSRP